MNCIQVFGFRLIRFRSSHNFFDRPKIKKINKLTKFARKAKPFQVKQFLKIVDIHGLNMETR